MLIEKWYIHELNDEIVMKGQRFKSVRSFFEEPIDSRILGIHLCTLKDIVCKVMVLPDENLFVVLPICHHSEEYFKI